jgi:protocatechuate 3,4-dioxygenase beta subunit
VLGVAGVAVVALAAWLVWSPADVQAPGAVANTASHSTAAAPVIAATPPSVPDAANESTERAPERDVAADAPLAPTTPMATLHGRCIDPDGTPLAGCKVQLSGSMRNPQRRDAWLRDHPAPENLKLDQISGTDGRFRFTFEPPPPFVFFVSAGLDGHVAVTADWSQIDAGADVDCGDVVLPRGAQLTGLLVDADGTPQTNAELNTRRRGDERSMRANATFAPWDGSYAKTDANGRFVFRSLFLPGTYMVSHRRSGGYHPIGDVEIPASLHAVDVRLVVESTPAKPTIWGRVVDAAGQPIARAWVSADERGLGLRDNTSADGTFAIERNEREHGPITLLAEREGYEPARTATRIEWGTKGVELVLRPAPGVAVRVTDPDDEPVAQYSVRVTPRERSRWTSSDFEVRARGPFADGTATIPTASGKWTVVVEFPASAGLVTSFTPIEMAGATLRLDLRAERPATRTLHVVDATGQPIAGTHVQVCDLVDGELEERTWVRPIEQFFMASGMKRALVCHECVTDADGRCQLLGPGSREVGVLVLGPGHVLLRQLGVRLDLADELEVTVQRGARMKGQVVPPEAVEELHRMLGLGSGAAFPADTCPTIALHRQLGGRHEAYPGFGQDNTAWRVDASGAFEVGGIAPGPWRLILQAWRLSTKGSLSRFTTDAIDVVLPDGATTLVDVDLAALLPGTLEATVTHNGAPLANVDVELRCTHGVNEQGQPLWQSERVPTDAQGHFTYVGRPGDYRPDLPHGGGTLRWLVPATTSAAVVRGQTTHHTFAIWSGKVKATLRGADGAPAVGVTLFVDTGSGGPLAELTASDANGVVEVELPAGTTKLLALPKRLQSMDARMRAWSESAQAGAGANDPVVAARLLVATVNVTAEQPVAIEVVLPPEWEK